LQEHSDARPAVIMKVCINNTTTSIGKHLTWTWYTVLYCTNNKTRSSAITERLRHTPCH